MKKLGFCLLALCLVGYTVGCGKSGEEGTTPPPAETGTGAGTDTTDPTGTNADDPDTATEGDAAAN